MNGQGNFSFQNTLGADNKWEWVAEDTAQGKMAPVQNIGGGWGAEGSNDYKWHQYDSPPVLLKKPPTTETKIDNSVTINFDDFFEADRTPREQSENITVINIPLIGRMNLVRDTQGFIQASVVLLYWIYGSWSIFTLLLIPHYQEENINSLYIFWYGLVSILCILSFVKAVAANPGRIPLSSKRQLPPKKEDGVKPGEYCARCAQSRPAKSHHCSRCGQCVRKMDHHCPWINNCVGEDNRFVFVQLVMYAFLMSFTALVYLVLNAYFWPQCEMCKTPDSFALRHRNDLLIVCLITSSLMILLGGGLYFTQLCLVRYDMTTLDFYKFEDEMRLSGKTPWEIRPQAKRSCMDAFTDLCGRVPICCWFYPCRTRIPPAFITAVSDSMHSL